MLREVTLSKLEEVSHEALSSPRLRKNFNLHEHRDTVQRFFNVLIPGTYVRPHRHLGDFKTETMVLVRGAMVAVFFDSQGTVIKKAELSFQTGLIAIDLDPNVWHTIYTLEEPTIYFECKCGPYVPLEDKDFASWAPKEGSPEVNSFLEKLINSKEFDSFS